MIWRSKEKASPNRLSEYSLHTDRLILRPASSQDYAQWRSVREQNRDYLQPFEPTWPERCLDPDFFARRVERLSQDWRFDRGYAFLIFEQGGALVGGININNVVRGAGQYASLGYWLDEKIQGRGYMTEAAHAVLSYAFNDLRLERMNAATLVHNAKSRAMLMRLDFAEEGFAKAYIQIDGKRQDHVLYGLNAADFLGAS